MPYIKPIILADEIDAVSRNRTVEIIKEKVYKDIEAVTYKYAEGSGLQDPKDANAVSADVQENLDGGTIARYVEFRDAQLRTAIQFCLRSIVYTERERDLLDMSGRYYYFIEVPEEFHDDLLRSVTEYMHRFLVWGALADWYRQFGNFPMADSYERNLDTLLDKIKSALRGRSIEKRPLQPFGPAKMP